MEKIRLILGVAAIGLVAVAGIVGVVIFAVHDEKKHITLEYVALGSKEKRRTTLTNPEEGRPLLVPGVHKIELLGITTAKIRLRCEGKEVTILRGQSKEFGGKKITYEW